MAEYAHHRNLNRLLLRENFKEYMVTVHQHACKLSTNNCKAMHYWQTLQNQSFISHLCKICTLKFFCFFFHFILHVIKLWIFKLKTAINVNSHYCSVETMCKSKSTKIYNYQIGNCNFQNQPTKLYSNNKKGFFFKHATNVFKKSNYGSNVWLESCILNK